jgi:hypothetical protein
MFVECTVEYPQCLPPTAYAFGQYSFPELSAVWRYAPATPAMAHGVPKRVWNW